MISQKFKVKNFSHVRVDLKPSSQNTDLFWMLFPITSLQASFNVPLCSWSRVDTLSIFVCNITIFVYIYLCPLHQIFYPLPVRYQFFSFVVSTYYMYLGMHTNVYVILLYSLTLTCSIAFCCKSYGRSSSTTPHTFRQITVLQNLLSENQT